LVKFFDIDTILFDMDGVLVDVTNSYRAVIKLTAEHFCNTEVTLKEIQEYKHKGGYNNDWDLTEAIIKSKEMNVSRDRIEKHFQNLYKGNNWDGLITSEKWLPEKSFFWNTI